MSQIYFLFKEMYIPTLTLNGMFLLKHPKGTINILMSPKNRNSLKEQFGCKTSSDGYQYLNSLKVSSVYVCLFICVLDINYRKIT